MQLIDNLQNKILTALNRRHAPEVGRSAMYQGTVADPEIARRRAANKVAKASRKKNRSR